MSRRGLRAGGPSSPPGGLRPRGPPEGEPGCPQRPALQGFKGSISRSRCPSGVPSNLDGRPRASEDPASRVILAALGPTAAGAGVTRAERKTSGWASEPESLAGRGAAGAGQTSGHATAVGIPWREPHAPGRCQDKARVQRPRDPRVHVAGQDPRPPASDRPPVRRAQKALGVCLQPQGPPSPRHPLSAGCRPPPNPGEEDGQGPHLSHHSAFSEEPQGKGGLCACQHIAAVEAPRQQEQNPRNQSGGAPQEQGGDVGTPRSRLGWQAAASCG